MSENFAAKKQSTNYIKDAKFPFRIALVFLFISYALISVGYGTWNDYFILAIPFLLLAAIFLVLSLFGIIKNFSLSSKPQRASLKKLLIAEILVIVGLAFYFVRRAIGIPFITLLVSLAINLSTKTNVDQVLSIGTIQNTPPRIFPSKKISLFILKFLGVALSIFIVLYFAVTNIGRHQTDKIVNVVDSNGGEIIGKSGLKMVIPAKIFNEPTKVTLALKQFNFILEKFLPHINLKMLALLSIDINTGLLGQMVPPAHANLIATYDVPLDLKIPISDKYSGNVLIGEIANYTGQMSIRAIDVGKAEGGFAYFQPPTIQDEENVRMYDNTFVVLALPSDVTIFKKDFVWPSTIAGENYVLDTAIAKGPFRSIISVTNKEGRIALPVPSGESMVYVYSYSHRVANYYFYRPDSKADWTLTNDEYLMEKFFKKSEINLSPRVYLR